MNPPEIETVEIDDARLGFHLRDGRWVSVPLEFYPTLQRASMSQRAHFVIYPFSVHWPDLDVDLDAECLLRGAHELPFYVQRNKLAGTHLAEDPARPSDSTPTPI
jgi:Protein of unknown function (DUF2442)